MKLQVINEQELLGQDFKVYGDLENPLFLAKDVARWIDYDISNVSKMVKNVDDDEKVITRTNNTSATFLTEDGLYEVLMQSRKPIAKKFKKAVKQILKDIRKHGMYAKDELLENPDLLIEVATKYKEERNKRIELEQEKVLLESTIAEYEPKISYLDMILNSEDTVTVTQIAQDYGMTANQFNKILVELKVQWKVNGQWVLTRIYKGQGYVKSKTAEVPRKNGSLKIVMNTRWTQKGRVMLYELLKAEGYYPEFDLKEIA
ncbi:phage antirepressor [Vagococcus salmoninarum]|uniref:Phage antirepressor protein n=1 Tax=Vagococcus salmoninarum TaxID=2739 RepID=A0A429ZSN2_9ENTE|nr:phage antirepressor KilAC domain-containing protein [Vagococcus salmoninarum]RST96629.1 phage antirepressor protein [Vagococcus salmoninarum]